MRILFIQKRILFPVDSGWKIRTLNVLRYLAQKHQVTYLCNTQPADDEWLESMRSLGMQLETIPWQETPRGGAGFYRDLLLNLFSRYPYTVNKDFDPRLRRRAVELLAGEPFDLVICDFVQMARNVIGLNGPPKLLFQHNVEAEIPKRLAQQSSGWLRRQYMSLQWKKMKRFEADAGRKFDAVVAVSERDKAIFEKEYGWQHVDVIDTAVDADYFQPSGRPEHPDRVLFVGSLDWLPNIDGVTFFVNKVWPTIRAARPEATFQIVGRNPTAAIERLAEVDGVEVVGTVPDVRPHLEEAAVVVVPVLAGGGTRIKIYEAMAMGKAVVSTTLGAEGLALTPGEHIELADSPQELAAEVIGLLRDEQTRHSLALCARDLVCGSFSTETVAPQFHLLCKQLVSNIQSECRSSYESPSKPHSIRHQTCEIP